MKKIFFYCLIILTCGTCQGESQQCHKSVDKPWNISVYLDLSDRLLHGSGEKQILRDTAIVSHLIEKFSDNVVQHKIVPCHDKFRVFFFPTDVIQNASQLGKSLTVDLEKLDKTPAQKKQKLISMKGDILGTIVSIYNEALENKKWVGSDIWGFFDQNENKISDLCIKDGYKNVLIILTDGYIYHKDTAKKGDKNSYSYILPQNLTENLRLIKCNSNLSDVDVLFLEVNPMGKNHYTLMKNVIETWLKEMDVENYRVVKTDISSSIFPIIDDFLE